MSSKRILGVRINIIDYNDVCNYIESTALSKRASYIVAANVHVVMTAFFNSEYRSVLRCAEIIIPDGMPLVWALRWLGGCQKNRVYGPDLMLAWCERASQAKLPLYLYGGTLETLNRLSNNLKDQFPFLEIAGTHSPPFRPLTSKEKAQDIEKIKKSGAAVVLIGLGCPKQERWMYENSEKLNAVMIGVGAAFRFHSGEVKQAPTWMMRAGLEWLFRLIQEPERLWYRYCVTNTAFVILFAIQLIGHRLKGFRKQMLRQESM